MANDGQWKALLAGKQLEIDKLKRKIKEKEDQVEQERINQGGWNNDNTRQRSNSPRKKAKRTSKSSISDK